MDSSMVDGTNASNREMFEELDELIIIEDTDVDAMPDNSQSADGGGVLKKEIERLQIEYVDELEEVVDPKMEHISGTNSPTIKKRKRENYALQNEESSDEDDAISKAVLELGLACQTLSVALTGLARVISTRKKRR